MNFQEFSKTWSRLHGDVAIKGIVKAWLRISFICAKAFTSPNVITLLGLLFGILTCVLATTSWSLLFLTLSLFADGIDGSVAIRHGKISKFGAVLDATVDRIVEFLWVIAFIRICPTRWVDYVIVAAWLVAQIQEYLRARLGGIGIVEIMRTTLSERPVRASLLFVALVIRAVDSLFNASPSQSHTDLLSMAYAVIAVIWLVLQLVSVFSVARDGYERLR